jgi:hypothetical protein
MELTPEEKHRIYEEEKARLDAQNQIKKEVEAEKKRINNEAEIERKRKESEYSEKLVKVVGIVFAFLILLLVILSVGKESKQSIPKEPSVITGQGHAKKDNSVGHSSPSDVGLVKGLGRDVLNAELSKWESIGLVTNYEFSESKVTVYLNHSDWISLPSSTQADFKAGIRLKWPDGSVSYRDSQTGESL